MIWLGLVFVLGTVALSLGIYAGARWLAGVDTPPLTGQAASATARRVAALHGLVLALVFAQELDDYADLRADLVAEATALANIHGDIARYDPDGAATVQQAVVDYVAHVVGEEWADRDDTQFADGWALHERIYLAALDLDPQTPRQDSLRDAMIADAQHLAALRQQRESTALFGMSTLFWVAAIAGTVLVTVPYFVFPPTRENIALLCLYSAYSGLMMFTIYAFSDPFAEPGRLAPSPFEQLIEGEIGQRLTSG
ncbi:hypothetical protein [Roseobacter sp. HKCCA0434]|uniref:bestrophin-like domain n=1 Tax=Roseobacter sp. HKCCA0434 TaxID=3079297 RepID=UPI002905F02F|nr:hypothetical protein [Roseobacter sp. HKCCA0434]